MMRPASEVVVYLCRDVVDMRKSINGLSIMVEQAMERIENGDYEFCIDCGNEIGAPRLMANSISKRCVPCQEKREDDRDERDATPSL